jgi:hypothetical protein
MRLMLMYTSGIRISYRGLVPGGHMAVTDVQGAPFDMGRTASRAFSVVGQNIATFGALSLLVGIPLAVLSYGGPQFGRTLAARLTDPRAFGFYAVVGLLYLIGAFVMQAGVVEGTVATLRGKRASLGNCLSVGIGAFVPLLLLTLLMTLGIMGGMLLLIVPGIIVYLMWSVAVPVYVVEKTTIGGALSRSSDLTRGHRWAVLGLILAFAILNVLIGAVFGLIIGLGLRPTPEELAAGGNLASILITTVAQMIGVVLTTTLISSIYYELRVIKEGIGPEALATVFD